MAHDELDADTHATPPEEDASVTATDGPPAAEPDEGSGAAAGRRRDDDVSWLGCVWLIIVPGIIFAAVVITLNWLGC